MLKPSSCSFNLLTRNPLKVSLPPSPQNTPQITSERSYLLCSFRNFFKGSMFSLSLPTTSLLRIPFIQQPPLKKCDRSLITTSFIPRPCLDGKRNKLRYKAASFPESDVFNQAYVPSLCSPTLINNNNQKEKKKKRHDAS